MPPTAPEFTEHEQPIIQALSHCSDASELTYIVDKHKLHIEPGLTLLKKFFNLEVELEQPTDDKKMATIAQGICLEGWFGEPLPNISDSSAQELILESLHPRLEKFPLFRIWLGEIGTISDASSGPDDFLNRLAVSGLINSLEQQAFIKLQELISVKVLENPTQNGKLTSLIDVFADKALLGNLPWIGIDPEYRIFRAILGERRAAQELSAHCLNPADDDDDARALLQATLNNPFALNAVLRYVRETLRQNPLDKDFLALAKFWSNPTRNLFSQQALESNPATKEQFRQLHEAIEQASLPPPGPSDYCDFLHDYTANVHQFLDALVLAELNKPEHQALLLETLNFKGDATQASLTDIICNDKKWFGTNKRVVADQDSKSNSQDPLMDPATFVLQAIQFTLVARELSTQVSLGFDAFSTAALNRGANTPAVRLRLLNAPVQQDPQDPHKSITLAQLLYQQLWLIPKPAFDTAPQVFEWIEKRLRINELITALQSQINDRDSFLYTLEQLPVSPYPVLTWLYAKLTRLDVLTNTQQGTRKSLAEQLAENQLFGPLPSPSVDPEHLVLRTVLGEPAAAQALKKATSSITTNALPLGFAVSNNPTAHAVINQMSTDIPTPPASPGPKRSSPGSSPLASPQNSVSPTNPRPSRSPTAEKVVDRSSPSNLLRRLTQTAAKTVLSRASSPSPGPHYQHVQENTSVAPPGRPAAPPPGFDGPSGPV